MKKEIKINPINITIIDNFATFLLPNLSITLSALNLTINCAAAPKKSHSIYKIGVLNISLIKITDQSIPAPSINIADKVKNTKTKILFEGITNKEGFSFNVGREGATIIFFGEIENQQ